jgi:tripartite-type tricarboxylate transporter receptor subunit TctC
MKQAAWLFLAFALSAITSPAIAQDNYPSSPVRVVVGFPPGAGANAIARLLAQTLSVQMNANFVVDNRDGANGNIANELVAKSKPDGYALLVTTATMVLSRAFGEKLGYDMLTDLAPVALVASSPYFLVVHPSVPVNSVEEFIAYAKANPDKLAYGSGGFINFLRPMLFMQSFGLKALHVPYKGGGAAMVDLLAGRIQFRFADIAQVVPLIKDKRLKVLAFTGLKRAAELPDVPTLAETVMPGVELAGNWYGVMAPAKTSPAIVNKLSGEILKTLQNPDIISKLAQQGQLPFGASSNEFGAYLRNELERWTKVIKDNNIKPE